ncbi:hypothetical protein RHSIM_Rhsim06G0019400 [Rhododendron simsii]|uniref:Thymidine kinase n=1 Tax=Rhododendron simsii TaxID=118357 RepID=A0A834GTC6_RHOSS|nr:hypothetical protein RHSIM_Rhsim06G0019400 [Rhododendron simsii]
MESPWKGIWLPRPTPAIRKPLTEEDLDGLDDEYFEPDPNCWDEDEDCDLFDYGTVVSTEEMAQAEKDWKIRKKGNIDPESHGVHITVRREENKEDHAKIHCDLYYQIMINRFVDEIHKSKEEKMERANVEEAQFFDDLSNFCCKAADLDGRTIVIARLDGNWKNYCNCRARRQLPVLTKLTARCELCGSGRFSPHGRLGTELIGGFDVYKTVCCQHYVNGQAVVEAVQNVLKP